MTHDPAAAAQQIVAITAALDEVSTGLKQYASVLEKSTTPSDLRTIGNISKSHTDLVANVRTLNRAVRGPVDMMFAQIENAAYTGAVRALLEMGVFEALPLDGTGVPRKELAEKLKVEEDLLVRLMRMAVPEMFAETTPGVYSHTPYSQVYMIPGIRGAFKLMLGEYSPIFNKLSEFFTIHGWTSPQSELTNPYTFTHQTNGLTMWEHVLLSPTRAKEWNEAMQAQGVATSFAIAIYPFRDVLKEKETNDETVLLVDVGGGLGHATETIKGLIGEGVKGRLVLQDRPNVLAEIEGELVGIERMEHDFFTPNPVKGALIYYIRRCIHDWNDSNSLKILQNIACSMTKGVSRLLIAECIIPETGVDVEAAWMDLTMMCFTGRERTKAQWEALLQGAGLRLVKTYQITGTLYGVVEAELV